MPRKKNLKQEKLLTELELELMGILWRISEGTVHDVLASLPSQRKLAYTSVSTVLRILEQKGIVGSRKEGRGHLYFPKLPKQSYEIVSLQHLVKKVFDGTPSSLVRRLVETEDLSEQEMTAIQKILSERGAR